MTRDFFQLNPCGHSPYVTSCLMRRWLTQLTLSLPYNISARITQKHPVSSVACATVAAETCFPSRCPETGLMNRTISRSLHSNGTTRYNNIMRIILLCQRHWSGPDQEHFENKRLCYSSQHLHSRSIVQTIYLHRADMSRSERNPGHGYLYSGYVDLRFSQRWL
jgi:hypothetical protein